MLPLRRARPRAASIIGDELVPPRGRRPAAPRAAADRPPLLRLRRAPAGATSKRCCAPRLGGGADIVQLREKELGRSEIERAAETFRRVADNYSALFILNDDPGLARSCNADGVHVGQDDVAAEQARELLGPEAIIGLSTHSEEQIAAAAGRPVDYISVGPIWETPTKAGRPGRRPRASSPTPPSTRPIPSSRSAASTPATPPRWSPPAPGASARCGRSATPPTPPPRRARCGRPSPTASGAWRPVAEVCGG